MADEKIENKNQEVRNPGTFMNLSDKCTNIFPVLYDGFRISIHRGLSRHFRVIHSINLSSITPGNYRFGATYVGDKEIRPNEGSPVVFGDVDSKGSMNACMYHLFGKRFKVKFDAQMENRAFVNSQLTCHYFGNTYTASALLVNSDIMKKSGGLLFQYLQNVTPNFCLGTEISFFKNIGNFKNPTLQVPDKFDSQVSLAGRYTMPHATWSTALSFSNVLLSCYKQASEQIEFGLELNTNFRTNESVGSLAYRITLQDRGIVFRGCIDTNTNVGSVFEKRVCDTPFSFSVSSNLNYRSSNFRLGLGFIIE